MYDDENDNDDDDDDDAGDGTVLLELLLRGTNNDGNKTITTYSCNDLEQDAPSRLCKKPVTGSRNQPQGDRSTVRSLGKDSNNRPSTYSRFSNCSVRPLSFRKSYIPQVHALPNSYMEVILRS